ncbi:MAG: ABC transporter ATP-binding protein [Patescibacteria group bacterium]|jgi:ABC-2 type transport system ATP-binding protein/lipopolysaccharide transport system ATP-binding protein
MNETAIEVKDVSKSYKIKGDIFWALKDVSFNVEKGEAVGIIGANGAGKTTLLRLLAGVTSQSKGQLEINGAIAPLIQVGAGFHPELTGRENIYLNGIIMGLSKKRIDEKFDDIIRFAELERFIDTPVKNYSSGMYVRLGFSVAIHVDADTLLIDEILSVGDLSFQRKCLDAMSGIRKSEKSIIFVSHNLSAIRGLCDRVIWMKDGKIEKEGPPDNVVAAYVQFMEHKSEFIQDCKFVGQKTRWGTGEVRIEKIRVLNSNNEESDKFSFGEEMRVRFEFKSNKKIESPVFWIGIITDSEIKIAGTYFNKERTGHYTIEGEGALECTLKNLSLRPGLYHLVVGVYDEYGLIAFDRIGRAWSFTIKCDYKDDHKKFRGYGAEGIVDFENEWKLEKRKYAEES